MQEIRNVKEGEKSIWFSIRFGYSSDDHQSTHESDGL